MALVSPPRKVYASTMAAENKIEKVKSQPSTSRSSSPRAYIEMPDENTVITAKENAFSVRVFSSNRSRRYSGTERARLP